MYLTTGGADQDFNILDIHFVQKIAYFPTDFEGFKYILKRTRRYRLVAQMYQELHSEQVIWYTVWLRTDSFTAVFRDGKTVSSFGLFGHQRGKQFGSEGS